MLGPWQAKTKRKSKFGGQNPLVSKRGRNKPTRQPVISKQPMEMTQRDGMFSPKKSILLPQQRHSFEPRWNLNGGGGAENQRKGLHEQNNKVKLDWTAATGRMTAKTTQANSASTRPQMANTKNASELNNNKKNTHTHMQTRLSLLPPGGESLPENSLCGYLQEREELIKCAFNVRQFKYVNLKGNFCSDYFFIYFFTFDHFFQSTGVPLN